MKERADEQACAARRLRAFEAAFVAVFAAEYWCRALPKWESLGTHYTLSLGLVPLACALTFVPRWRSGAFALLAANHAVVVWNELPATGNHAYLELILCVLAALLDPRWPAEARSYTFAVRWLAALVFFFSGLQKLLHGYYFQGQYLAYSLAAETFQPILRPLLSAAEYQRLLSYSHEPGGGPFLVESLPLLAVSNAIWVAELLLGPLLLWQRTRGAAALVGLALLAGIEVGAREVFFGLVFGNAVLTFFAAPVSRCAVPVFVALAAYLVAARAGLAPAFTFY